MQLEEGRSEVTLHPVSEATSSRGCSDNNAAVITFLEVVTALIAAAAAAALRDSPTMETIGVAMVIIQKVMTASVAAVAADVGVMVAPCRSALMAQPQIITS